MNIGDILCGTILSHRGETYITIDYITALDADEVKFIAISASKKLMLVTFTVDNYCEITSTRYDILTENIMSVYSKLMGFVSKEITILTQS